MWTVWRNGDDDSRKWCSTRHLEEHGSLVWGAAELRHQIATISLQRSFAHACTRSTPGRAGISHHLRGVTSSSKHRLATTTGYTVRWKRKLALQQRSRLQRLVASASHASLQKVSLASAARGYSLAPTGARWLCRTLPRPARLSGWQILARDARHFGPCGNPQLPKWMLLGLRGSARHSRTMLSSRGVETTRTVTPAFRYTLLPTSTSIKTYTRKSAICLNSPGRSPLCSCKEVGVDVFAQSIKQFKAIIPTLYRQSPYHGYRVLRTRTTLWLTT